MSIAMYDPGFAVPDSAEFLIFVLDHLAGAYCCTKTCLVHRIEEATYALCYGLLVVSLAPEIRPLTTGCLGSQRVV